jgi:hypothetical protein
MTDGELQALVDEITGYTFGFVKSRLHQLADECRRARAEEATLKKLFADLCIDDDALARARKLGFEEGEKAASTSVLKPMSAGTVGALLSSIKAIHDAMLPDGLGRR